MRGAVKETRETRVLVVDDNPGTTTATVKFLEMCGYSARGAVNGDSAWTEALDWRPDVVIVDVGLPDVDGFSLQQKIREQQQGRAVTFIAISGRDDEATVARAREAGFAHYLVKPVSLETLRGVLRAASP